MLIGIHVDKLLWLGGDGVWDGNMEGNVGFNEMNWVNYSCSLLFYGKRWDFINVFGLIGGNWCKFIIRFRWDRSLVWIIWR